MKLGFLSFILLSFVFPAGAGAEDAAGKEGKITGQSFVNLRSGPDLTYPSTAVLKEGTEVVVEREEAPWYLVSLRDGRRGYVHKQFIRLLGDAGRREVPSSGSPGEGEKEKRAHPPAPQAGAMALLKVLEGREREILWWFGLGLCVFILGWICGGNYYRRRDRIRRTRLRF